MKVKRGLVIGHLKSLIWILFILDDIQFLKISLLRLLINYWIDMKKFLTLMLLLYSMSVFSQNIQYKEYNYTQFMELLQNETDSVFRLSNAIVNYDSKSDKAWKSAILKLSPLDESKIMNLELPFLFISKRSTLK